MHFSSLELELHGKKSECKRWFWSLLPAASCPDLAPHPVLLEWEPPWGPWGTAPSPFLVSHSQYGHQLPSGLMIKEIDSISIVNWHFCETCRMLGQYNFFMIIFFF